MAKRSNSKKKVKEPAKNDPIDKIARLIRNRIEVWVRRSSGQWHKGIVKTIDQLDHSVGVFWEHPLKPGKMQGKYVSIRDFLRWQEQTHSTHA